MLVSIWSKDLNYNEAQLEYLNIINNSFVENKAGDKVNIANTRKLLTKLLDQNAKHNNVFLDTNAKLSAEERYYFTLENIVSIIMLAYDDSVRYEGTFGGVDTIFLARSQSQLVVLLTIDKTEPKISTIRSGWVFTEKQWEELITPPHRVRAFFTKKK